ncbi:MAG: class I SAM-dependent methyltransferase [Burkholderiales bacterium]
MSSAAPTQRFSNRVADYIRARPGYPDALLGELSARFGLQRTSVIADVGSGTGLLATLFLEHGNPVFGVEPNREMREAGESLLARYSDFTSVGAAAEATSLPDASVDFVTAGQAFHWFDRPRARNEFARILKPGGRVVLVWNDRRLDTTDFLRGYEDLLVRRCPEYLKVVHRNVDEAVLTAFFAPCPYAAITLENVQVFDWETLVARHDSQSYVPAAGPERDSILADLRALFDATAENGRVRFEYDTRAFVGTLRGA